MIFCKSSVLTITTLHHTHSVFHSFNLFFLFNLQSRHGLHNVNNPLCNYVSIVFHNLIFFVITPYELMHTYKNHSIGKFYLKVPILWIIHACVKVSYRVQNEWMYYVCMIPASLS